jgi:hypothetical protein
LGDTLIAVLGTLAGIAIGAILPLWYQKLNRRSELLLPKKVEALSDLHRVLVEYTVVLERAYFEHTQVGPSKANRVLYRSLQEADRNCRRTVDIATIYVDDPQALAAIYDVTTFLYACRNHISTSTT